MSDLDRIQHVVGEWGERTFPTATPATIIAHLREEVSELEAACAMHHVYGEVYGEQSGIAEEAADCLLLLLYLAHREGFSLHNALDRKHTINVGRTWETDGGAKGYRKHLEVQP